MADQPKKSNRYAQIIEHIFFTLYRPDMRHIAFRREDFEKVAIELGIALPKNLGDILYSFKYRVGMPSNIRATAPEGETWILRNEGRAQYAFVLILDRPLVPNPMMAETKIPDATPGLVAMYAFDDEQALLTRLRYNRLIDIFTGVTCYSLQNHLRTTVDGIGQIETDEIYVGVDHFGAHYVFPVQAKGGRDKLNIVQIEQDIALCRSKFSELICRPIGAQFMDGSLIALFEFEAGDSGVAVFNERHYRLVLPENMSDDEIALYKRRANSRGTLE